jgi:hypothetical protein
MNGRSTIRARIARAAQVAVVVGLVCIIFLGSFL